MNKDLPQGQENYYFNSNVLHFANAEKERQNLEAHVVYFFNVNAILDERFSNVRLSRGQAIFVCSEAS